MKLRSLLKHAAAVLLGLALLDAFCAWYYNKPSFEWPDGRATDVVCRPGALQAQAKEGIGRQRMDENGYNNPQGAGADGISVLFMGSSHLEGANVYPEENAALLLEAQLRAAGHAGRVYNIGMSGHTLPRNAANLPRALAAYAPEDYVVIETAGVVFGASAISAAQADGIARMDASSTRLPGWIIDRPLVRNLYKQFAELRAGAEDEGDAPLAEVPEALLDEYEAALTEWFSALNGEAAAAGVRLILCYHPHLIPQMDGSVRPEAPAACVEAFRRACLSAGVLFVDLTGSFLTAYAEDHVLPHGFANTAMGSGHLNARGHRLMAEALCRAILEAEGDQP